MKRGCCKRSFALEATHACAQFPTRTFTPTAQTESVQAKCWTRQTVLFPHVSRMSNGFVNIRRTWNTLPTLKAWLKTLLKMLECFDPRQRKQPIFNLRVFQRNQGHDWLWVSSVSIESINWSGSWSLWQKSQKHGLISQMAELGEGLMIHWNKRKELISRQ